MGRRVVEDDFSRCLKLYFKVPGEIRFTAFFFFLFLLVRQSISIGKVSG